MPLPSAVAFGLAADILLSCRVATDWMTPSVLTVLSWALSSNPQIRAKGIRTFVLDCQIFYTFTVSLQVFRFTGLQIFYRFDSPPGYLFKFIMSLQKLESMIAISFFMVLSRVFTWSTWCESCLVHIFQRIQFILDFRMWGLWGHRVFWKSAYFFKYYREFFSYKTSWKILHNCYYIE